MTDVQGNVDIKNMFKRVDWKDMFNNTERITFKFDNKRKGVTRSKDDVKCEVSRSCLSKVCHPWRMLVTHQNSCLVLLYCFLLPLSCCIIFLLFSLRV